MYHQKKKKNTQLLELRKTCVFTFRKDLTMSNIKTQLSRAADIFQDPIRPYVILSNNTMLLWQLILRGPICGQKHFQKVVLSHTDRQTCEEKTVILK